jgi:hypothetical protein
LKSLQESEEEVAKNETPAVVVDGVKGTHPAEVGKKETMGC